MRRSIATVSLSGTLRQKLEAVAAARFDAIELFEPDFIASSGSAAELRSLSLDLGLGIDLYQPFRDFEGMPDDVFRKSLDRAEAKFDLMQALGAPLLLVCSNTSPQSLGEPERAAAQLHALAERAARRNLRIGYEALAWGRWVMRYGQAWAIVERAGHPHLGLVLDSFHTLSLKDDPAGIAAIPGDRIFFVQMADAPQLAMDVLQWARHHRNFPGQGQFDCAGFLDQVLRAGYDGTLSLEIFNDVFRETPNRRTALDAMRSLLFLEAQVRGRLEQGRDALAAGATGAGATFGADEDADEDTDASARESARRALGRTSLFDPPGLARWGGFAFVEFAVDEAGAASLSAWFERLGFVRRGRHRSKAVELFVQGGIRLVVNAEPGSDARARFDGEGPSVCAVGIVTDDPPRAAARAAALLSARHDSPRGADELRLPAIVAPGGTVVHFVAAADAIDADFIAEGGAAEGSDAAVAPPAGRSSAGGLASIDHLAFGLGRDQFDTWTLFARAVLGLDLSDSLELADPFGLVRSVGVADADRAVRLVLNVSLGARTRTARQVSASGRSGGSVHHLALRCDDVFGAVSRLRARGVRFVAISPNYYDDLVARLDLCQALVRQMQALDILYDRSDGAGHYFHAYTEAFCDRFFFEVVQRTDYDGYGAVNAPARMASQEEARR